jgi:hypothetical protein
MVTSSANSPRYNGSMAAASPLLPRVQLRPLPQTNQTRETNQWSIALRIMGLGPQRWSQSMTAQRMISSLCSTTVKAVKVQQRNTVKQ